MQFAVADVAGRSILRRFAVIREAPRSFVRDSGQFRSRLQVETLGHNVSILLTKGVVPLARDHPQIEDVDFAFDREAMDCLMYPMHIFGRSGRGCLYRTGDNNEVPRSKSPQESWFAIEKI